MGEEVTLFMKPVCICGYVFDDLKMTETNYVDKEMGQPKKGLYIPFLSFDPPFCPQCGRQIRNVANRTFEKEQIFSDEYRIVNQRLITSPADHPFICNK